MMTFAEIDVVDVVPGLEMIGMKSFEKGIRY